MIFDVIIPTFHRYELLTEALESVKNQTYSNWHCWIAEDGSTGKTRSAIEPFLKDKRFHYLPGEHAGTPAAPRNRALKAGSAPYIAFLDDDDIWLPEKLQQQAEFIENHPRCILLGSNAFIMEENQDYRKDSLSIYFQKAPFGKVPYRKIVQDDYFINSSAVIKRSVLKYAGYQNETLHKGPDGEDHDLWLRIGLFGEMWLMESPLIIYRYVPSKNASTESALDKRREAYKSRFKIYQSALDGVGDVPSPLHYPEHDRQEHLCRREKYFYAAGPRFLGRLRHNIFSRLADIFSLPSTKQEQQNKAIYAYEKCKSRWNKIDNPCGIECIVFSKDRALQLHGLLSTFRQKVIPCVPIYVLYLASSSLHQKAYDDVKEIFTNQGVRFIQQKNNRSFKQDLMEIIFSLTGDILFFLVDDILFTESVDLNDILKLDLDEFVPSLRMGENIARCYVLQKPQKMPLFLNHEAAEGDKIVWQWSAGEMDWNYPLSVDGHFFARREMTAMAALISFDAPNSFENQLQIFRPWFLNRYGIGYKKSKIMNIPCNRVQTEVNNLSGNIDAAEMLAQWQQGYQIDYKKLFGMINESVHQEIVLPLTLRQRIEQK